MKSLGGTTSVITTWKRGKISPSTLSHCKHYQTFSKLTLSELYKSFSNILRVISEKNV